MRGQLREPGGQVGLRRPGLAADRGRCIGEPEEVRRRLTQAHPVEEAEPQIARVHRGELAEQQRAGQGERPITGRRVVDQLKVAPQ